MSAELLEAGDTKVKKGRWLYLNTKPAGWFLITAKWRSEVISGRNIHVAVNGRGANYLLDFKPDEKLSLSDRNEAG